MLTSSHVRGRSVQVSQIRDPLSMIARRFPKSLSWCGSIFSVTYVAMAELAARE
jgi:hypothetical protein